MGAAINVAQLPRRSAAERVAFSHGTEPRDGARGLGNRGTAPPPPQRRRWRLIEPDECARGDGSRCPGSAGPTKGWPAARFVAVGRRYEGPVIVLGGPDEGDMVSMIADGITRFIELGPGTALTGFMRRIDRRLEVVNVADNDSLARAAEALNA